MYYDSELNYIKYTNTFDTSIPISSEYAYAKIVVVDNTDGGYSNPITASQVKSDYKFGAKTGLLKKIEEASSVGIIEPADYTWTVGNLDRETGEKTDGVPKSSRNRTDNFIPIDFKNVSVNNTEITYHVFVFYYDDAKNYIGYKPFTDGNVKIDNENASWYKLVALDYSDATYSKPLDVEVTSKNITICKNHPIINDIYDKLDKIDEITYPQYYDEQIKSTIGNINSHGEIVGKDGTSFVFITDLHWGNNSKHSPALIDKIKKETSVNKVIIGGDYISSYATGKQDAIDVIRDCMSAYRADNVYPLFGNHDRNSVNTTSDVYLSKAEVYSSINAWMDDSAVYGNDYFNYYVDDKNLKQDISVLTQVQVARLPQKALRGYQNL